MTKTNKLLLLTIAILFACCTLLLAYKSNVNTVYLTGQLHGVENMQDKSLDEIQQEISLSPIDNSYEAKELYDKGELHKNLMFYRTDCPDCQREFSTWDNTHWQEMYKTTLFVCTRTDAGRELVRAFNVEEVPCVVEID